MTTATQATKQVPQTDDELLRQIDGAENTILVCKRNIEQAKAELLSRRQLLLKEKDEPYGAISIIVGNRKVTVTIPKKVEWDSDKLEKIYSQIEKDGSDPDEYIDVEFSIAESKYKAWPSDLKKEFQPARTVTPRNQSLKIKKAGE